MTLVRPSARARTRLAYKTCLRTPQREDAAPKSPEARRQFTRTEPSPADVWGAMRPRARRSAREERIPTSALRRRADAAAPNPVRWEARLAETAIARETVAWRRWGGPGSLSLSVCVSLLSVDRRHGARSSSSKRSARVQLCWDITPRGGGGGRGNIHTKNHICRRSRRLVDDPRAVGPKGPWRRPGAAGLPSKTLRRGCLCRRCGRPRCAMQPRAFTGLAGDRPRHPRKPVLNPLS